MNLHLVLSLFFSFFPPSLSFLLSFILSLLLTGTLGVSKDVAVGFQNIRLKFEVDTDADEALMAKVLQVTERYCVIFQSLKTPPTLESTIVRTA